jgi:hypothetical protein
MIAVGQLSLLEKVAQRLKVEVDPSIRWFDRGLSEGQESGCYLEVIKRSQFL